VPKKTTERVPGPDDWAAARIRHERELRGWSTAELARRVTEAGVSMRQQQVWQVESGEPPRKLSVGEAATIAKVLDLTIAELLAPPEEVANQNLIELGRVFAEWRRDAGLLAARFRDIADRAAQLNADEGYRYISEVVTKYGGYDDLAEQAASELDGLAHDYTDIARSVREHDSVWSLIATMRELIPVEGNAGPSHGESIRRIDRKNPPRYPKSGEDE
jgi:transcriptional regulator with XRE-family HTH domain